MTAADKPKSQAWPPLAAPPKLCAAYTKATDNNLLHQEAMIGPGGGNLEHLKDYIKA
jgi:hypothetical protein